jgi:hypothetical protein
MVRMQGALQQDSMTTRSVTYRGRPATEYRRRWWRTNMGGGYTYLTLNDLGQFSILTDQGYCSGGSYLVRPTLYSLESTVATTQQGPRSVETPMTQLAVCEGY